jgi:hypothetical protein
MRRSDDARSNVVRAQRAEAPACGRRTEIAAAPPSEVIGGAAEQDFMYVLGDADVWVSNVSPHFEQHFPGEEGGVEFILHVDWPDPLDVAFTITVEDLPPIDIQN